MVGTVVVIVGKTDNLKKGVTVDHVVFAELKRVRCVLDIWRVELELVLAIQEVQLQSV